MRVTSRASRACGPRPPGGPEGRAPGLHLREMSRGIGPLTARWAGGEDRPHRVVVARVRLVLRGTGGARSRQAEAAGEDVVETEGAHRVLHRLGRPGEAGPHQLRRARAAVEVAGHDHWPRPALGVREDGSRLVRTDVGEAEGAGEPLGPRLVHLLHHDEVRVAQRPQPATTRNVTETATRRPARRARITSVARGPCPRGRNRARGSSPRRRAGPGPWQFPDSAPDAEQPRWLATTAHTRGGLRDPC